VAALRRAGFVEKRQKGSHLMLQHERKQRTTIVSIHRRNLPMPALKRILKQAGLSEDEFRKLL